MPAAFIATLLFALSVLAASRSVRLLGGNSANFWRLVVAALTGMLAATPTLSDKPEWAGQGKGYGKGKGHDNSSGARSLAGVRVLRHGALFHREHPYRMIAVQHSSLRAATANATLEAGWPSDGRRRPGSGSEPPRAWRMVAT